MTRRRAQVGFDAIAIEGGLLTPDFLVTIAELKAPRQTPPDYRVPRGIQVRDEIGRAWRIAVAHWPDVEASIAAGGRVAVPVSAILRDAFGWGSLENATGPIVVEGRSFPISAFAVGGTVPVVFAAPAADLDKALSEFGDEQKRRSAFGLVQEYLNATPALWGVATNGTTLRITRDNASFTRPSWIEADLARIMREERYAEFSLLWLLLHESRFGSPAGLQHECILEQWRVASASAGMAARERLRDGVEAALRELGNGFLQHPANVALRERLQSGSLDGMGYQQQLLRLVYRLIFLLVAEERELLHPEGSDQSARALYREGYSLTRLRQRALRRRAHDRHEDGWAALRVVLLACLQGQPRLAIPALGGLFTEQQTPDLAAAHIANRFFLAAIYRLTWLEDNATLVRVNWRDMGTEELGSVYESLLELVPVVRNDARDFGFVGDAAQPDEHADRSVRGHARKLTGSYYTPDSLVQALLDSALDPIAQRAESAPDAERAILSLAILDPACGSGHFLLGAARRLASRLARIRSDGTPPPAVSRAALRDVITHCIYGVDKNAMAIELARIALWLEAIDPGRPLAFLDHHLIHGDAILGLMDPVPLEQGIPDEAYSALTGDDKGVAKELKKNNAKSRKELERERNRDAQQLGVSFSSDELARRLGEVDAMPDGSLGEIAAKESALREAMNSDANRSRFAQDAYVAAFLLRKVGETKAAIPTTGTLRDLAIGVNPSAGMMVAINEVARATPFLHWSVAFAPVMARGGFDCVIGNPPWEKVKLSEKEFFASRDQHIAVAANKARRQELIDELAESPPGSPGRRLFDAFETAKQEAEGTSAYARSSGRFPLTGSGDINLYALFAETALLAIRSDGRAGLVLPSGIASDAGTAAFFREVSNGRLVSMIDFENRDAIFPGVHRSTKFCLFTIGRVPEPVFTFFLTNLDQRFDDRRRFTLSALDLRRLNPNTRTAPIFRSKADAELTAKIYRNVPVLWDETREDGNPWGLSFARLFDMSNDSHLFSTAPGAGLVPLYEAKMIHQFDHRFATYTGADEDATREVAEEEKQDPEYRVRPRYWVPEDEVEARLRDRGWDRPWLLGWRDICRATDERTVIASVIPRVGAGNTLALAFPGEEVDAQHVACLLASFCSIALDYVARQKIGGTHLNFYLAKQLPVPAPHQFDRDMATAIAVRVAALISTNDMSSFREELVNAQPSLSVLAERSVIRAELDALVAKQFGIDRDDLRFVLDPSDRFGADHPSETFRVLKENDIWHFGEYRTRALVLDAWDRLIAPEHGVLGVGLASSEALLRELSTTMPLSAAEHLAFVVLALVRANGDRMERIALARAISLLRNPLYLIENTPTDLRPLATAWRARSGQTDSQPAHLLTVVNLLIERSALRYDIASSPAIYIITTAITPVEDSIHAWYRVEARLALAALRQLPAIEITRVESEFAPDQAAFVHAQIA